MPEPHCQGSDPSSAAHHPVSAQATLSASGLGLPLGNWREGGPPSSYQAGGEVLGAGPRTHIPRVICCPISQVQLPSLTQAPRP